MSVLSSQACTHGGLSGVGNISVARMGVRWNDSRRRSPRGGCMVVVVGVVLYGRVAVASWPRVSISYSTRSIVLKL